MYSMRSAMRSSTPVQIGEDFISKDSAKFSMRTWDETSKQTLSEFLEKSDLHEADRQQIMDLMQWA